MSQDCDRILQNPVWGLPRAVNFDDSLPTVLQWFKLCNFEHGKCFRPSSVMPTRVIDVNLQNDSSDLRLCQPPKGHNFPYVALSHCWGPSKTPPSSKTTKDNLASFKHEILTSTLPTSFQDAVYITRKLNIRYLWIDSLCIVQDDEDDWEIESAKMASVYQNAYVTIAATASASCKETLLAPRSSATIFKLDGQDEKSETFHARLHPLGSQSLAGSPLFKRAWAFQEMILSPRVLHFAEDQLYWQCRNDIFSEDCLVRLSSPLQKNFEVGRFVSQDEYGGWKLWWEWVQVYSALTLSDVKDKAAALAGLTYLYQQSREGGDEPLAGLWRSDLHFGLLWYSLGPKNSSDMEHVPSWSWFKMDSPIMSLLTVNEMWGRNLRRTANIQDAAVQWIGHQLTSPFAGGAITMESRIRPVNMQLFEANNENLTQIAQSGSSWTPSTEEQQKSVWKARGPIFSMDPIAEYIGDTPGLYTLYSVGNFSFDLDMPYQVPNVLCLEIVTASNPSDQLVDSDSTSRWLFRHDVLVIEPVVDNPNMYRRIGVGHILVGLYYLIQPTDEIVSSACDFFQTAHPYSVILV